MKLLLISSLLLFLVVTEITAASFGAGISSTRCNLDPNEGEVNDPCGTLYDGVCGGNYCRCHRGFKEHPNLHKCVRDNNPQQSQEDLFDDLPFDYEPPNGQNKPAQNNGPVGITSTRCRASDNPCGSLYNAICYQGSCACPSGTIENRSLNRCTTVNSRRPSHHEDDDDDNDFVINLFSGSKMITGDVITTTAVVLIGYFFMH